MGSLDIELDRLRHQQREGVKFYVIRSEGFGKQKTREIAASGLSYEEAKTEEKRLTDLQPEHRFGDPVYYLEREDYEATMLARKNKRQAM